MLPNTLRMRRLAAPPFAAARALLCSANLGCLGRHGDVSPLRVRMSGARTDAKSRVPRYGSRSLLASGTGPLNSIDTLRDGASFPEEAGCAGYRKRGQGCQLAALPIIRRSHRALHRKGRRAFARLAPMPRDESHPIPEGRSFVVRRLRRNAYRTRRLGAGSADTAADAGEFLAPARAEPGAARAAAAGGCADHSAKPDRASAGARPDTHADPRANPSARVHAQADTDADARSAARRAASAGRASRAGDDGFPRLARQ